MIKIQINRVHTFTYKISVQHIGATTTRVPGSTIDDTIESSTWYKHSHASRLENAYSYMNIYHVF